ncbi:LuxR C-terminal-related transcriptional regulator [Amycolatopsis sp. GM8]|uniref:LuxR C-terminal-related transcriptional regulator n=1 Tax=Amycolatopsis sp. GM8 TaxID=2896530 RepID=UPI001F029919|nr:LuxR C-terminal-related transcriptional regulator [Amycolatopsis sp. GM8]
MSARIPGTTDPAAYQAPFSEPADTATVRTAELRVLRDAIGNPGDEGTFIAVTGEPGTGKTQLLAALVKGRMWTEQPAVVYQCARNEQETVINAVRRLMRQARRSSAGHDGTGAETNVTRLRRRSPVRELLVVEDAHLADEQTVRELSDMASGATRPLADVVVSLRPRQTPVELAEAVAHGAAFGSTRQIGLGPLTDEQMLTLSSSRPYGSATLDLRHRSGGNPFNLCALQALEEAARSGNDTVAAPFEFALVRETRGLTLNERYVLNAAVVLRSRFDVDMLATVADLDPLIVPAVLGSLIRRDLVRADSSGSCFFSVRDGVVGTLLHRTVDPCWATQAHQRAIRALSAQSVTDRNLGFHLVHSLSHAETGELARIVDAACGIMDSDLSEALSWLIPVVAEVPVDSELGVRARLALSTALGLSGRMAESRELLFLVHESDYAVDQVALGEQIAFVTIVEGLLSEDVQAFALLTDFLCRDRLSDEEFWPRLVLAHDFRMAMQGLAADARQTEQALAAARRHGDEVSTAGLLGVRALATIAGENSCAALTDAEAASRILDRCPEHLVGRRLESVFIIGLANIYLGRYGEARRHLRRGVAIAQRRQHIFVLPTMFVLLSEAERNLGQLVQARDCADAAIIESGSGNSLRHAQAVALKSMSEVWLQPADSEQAKALAQLALAKQSPYRASVNGSASIAALSLAMSAWLNGDPKHCVALLLNDGKGLGLTGIPMNQRGKTWELLCAAAYDAGLPVSDSAARCEEYARAAPLPHNRGYAALARGHALRERDEHRDAARCYLDAADEFASVDMSIDQSYALGLAAGVLKGLGRASEAAETAALAHEIASRSRALTLQHWLSTQTAVPEPALVEPDVLGDLTRREREIAFLICSGMKRREIAERLYISTRTVDVHLTRIYRKTGVNSKVQLTLAITTATRSS